MTTYYVSTIGDNDNPGTIEEPWLTISYAVEQLSAGDTLNIRSGTYYERVLMRHSGSSGNYITIQAYTGETPIIDGVGISISATNGLFDLYDVDYVKLDHLGVRNSDDVIICCNSCTYIEVNNCITNKGVSSGIAFWWCDHVKAYNNTLIDSHYLSEGSGGHEESLTCAGTTNFELSHNEVYMSLYPSYFGNLAIDCKQGARYGTVHHNYIHDYDDGDAAGGIYMDAWDVLTGDIDVYNNYIKNSVLGIDLGSERAGTLENVRVYNNLIYNVGAVGVHIPERPAPYQYGIRRNIEIYNNTIYKARWNGGAGIYITAPSISNISVINNIVYFNNYNGEIVAGDASLLPYITCHNNLVYGPKYCSDDYPDCVELSDNPGGYPNIYGNITADPNFTSLVIPDFHLLLGSPAIDAGATIALVIDDYDGVARPQNSIYDIGALEYPSGAPPLATVYGPLVSMI